MNPDIFRAYDIRGVYGGDFEAHDFYTIAQAYARVMKPKTVVVGHDVRVSSPELWLRTAEGLLDAGVNVINIGEISTEMLYFAVVNYGADGGLTISASHNPAEYNGMKLVREQAIPISGDTGIMDIRDEAFKLEHAGRQLADEPGVVRSFDVSRDYLQHLRSFVNRHRLTECKLVLNSNCGLAGPFAEQLLEGTPVQIAERIFFEPDGTFGSIPEGRPDPLTPSNRTRTTDAILKHEADFGVAWDADADRCFFFDENGEFVEGCYVTTILAELLLRQHEGSGTIILDPRVIWPTQDVVRELGGSPVLNRVGHSFIKARMRSTDALFAGEFSGHYYFRRCFYTDNGLIPFLLVLEHLCKEGFSLAEWVDPLRKQYPVSGEINFELASQDQVQPTIEVMLSQAESWGNAQIEEPIDGVSVHYLDGQGERLWRLNVRASNTEPRMRLNVEAIQDESLLREKTEMLTDAIIAAGGERKTPFPWEDA